MTKNSTPKVIEHANRVFHAIEDRGRGGTWKTRKVIAAEVGITEREVRAAVEYINRLFQVEDGLTPLLSGPLGYVFSFDAEDVNGYAVQRTQQGGTILRNAYYRAIRPCLQAHGDPAAVSRNDRAVSRLLEDVEQVLVEMVV